MPSSGTGTGTFYATPIQTIAGNIFLCNSGVQTATPVNGGTIGATGTGLSTVGPVPDQLAPTDVRYGTYTMTATNPSGYRLVACSGSSSPNGTGTSATESVSVPKLGTGVGNFYVVPFNPALHISKTASPSTVSAKGSTVTYTFVVQNTGNVTVSNVTVNDIRSPAGALVSGPTCLSLSGPSGTCSGSSAALSSGQSATFTATYTVSQADLDNGTINNSATSTGTAFNTPVTSNTAMATVNTAQNPALTITKTPQPDLRVDQGQHRHLHLRRPEHGQRHGERRGGQQHPAGTRRLAHQRPDLRQPERPERDVLRFEHRAHPGSVGDLHRDLHGGQGGTTSTTARSTTPPWPTAPRPRTLRSSRTRPRRW